MKNKRVTKWLALILFIALAFNMSNTVAYASEIEDEHEYGEPNLSRWSYTGSTSEGLSIKSGGTATMTSTVDGIPGTTTKIIIYFYLQQYDDGWKNYKTYRDEVSSWYAVKEHSYSVPKGYKYRLRCTYYIYGPDNYHYDHFMEYTNEVSYY